jgi:hypothetical protein
MKTEYLKLNVIQKKYVCQQRPVKRDTTNSISQDNKNGHF